jgi:uncharacterized SAM-dependent methyltransferase
MPETLMATTDAGNVDRAPAGGRDAAVMLSERYRRRSTWRTARIRVEISTKFRRESLRDELGAASFTVERTWTDDDGDFALTLARRDG